MTKRCNCREEAWHLCEDCAKAASDFIYKLVALDSDNEARRKVTLQEIIDEAKLVLQATSL